MPEHNSRLTLSDSLVTRLRDARTAYADDASESNGRLLHDSVTALLDLVTPVPGEGEYAFDVTLKSVARVRAMSQEQAEQALREFESVAIDFVHGPVTITEGTCEHEFTLFQVDGKDI